VTPEDLKIEIPRWAGHIKIRNGNHEIPLVENVVRAPTLHRQKFAPNLRAAAESTCYWRMHSLFIWRKIGDIETQVQE
jgi:hypothetical protein